MGFVLSCPRLTYHIAVIVFMAPDVEGTPPGGVTVIHSLAQSLVESGMDATVWHGKVPPVADRVAPVVAGRQRTLRAGDVLVMPEFGGAYWSFLVGALPVVMLVQGPRGFVAGTPLDSAGGGAPVPGLADRQGGDHDVGHALRPRAGSRPDDVPDLLRARQPGQQRVPASVQAPRHFAHA